MAKRQIPAALRQLVEDRAAGCCEYCLSQQRYASHRFSIDHILPESLGGTNDPANLALCCQGCNNFKFTRTHAADPETGETVPLFNPRQQVWSEHFRWNENFTVILGTSPTGRATVKQLRLNRDILINQRIVYRAFGVHPPLTGLV